MANAFFPFFNHIDSLLNNLLPAWAVLCVWGVLTSALVMGIYFLLSPQKKIRSKKKELKELQKRLKESDEDFGDVMSITWINLRKSLQLLGIVIVPSLLSSLPALVMLLWVSTFYAYDYPETGDIIKIVVKSEGADVRILPETQVLSNSDDTYDVKFDKASQIRFLGNGNVVYKGIPTDPPVNSVGKKVWWNVFWENEAGYLPSDSKVDAIRFHFERRHIFSDVPDWMGTWEFVYFVTLFFSAVIIKIAFKIH